MSSVEENPIKKPSVSFAPNLSQISESIPGDDPDLPSILRSPDDPPTPKRAPEQKMGQPVPLREDGDFLNEIFDKTLFEDRYQDPKDKTRNVLFICEFLRPHSIDLAKECFNGGIHFTFRWRPTEEEWADYKKDGREPQWKPHDQFFKYMNALEYSWKPQKIEKKDVSWAQFKKKDFGNFFGYDATLTGVFSEVMELEDFPMDCQHLTMTFSIRNTKMQLVPMKYGTFLKSKCVGCTVGGLTVKSFFIDRFLSPPSANRKARGKKAVEVLWHFTYDCSRQYEFWIKRWGPYFTFLILMAFCSQSIDVVDDFADRMNYLVAISFVFAGYQFVLNDKLPDLVYLTLMDSFVLYCFSFIFVQISGNAFIFSSFSEDEDVLRFSDNMLWWASLSYLGLGCSYFIYAYHSLLNPREESVVQHSIAHPDAEHKHLGGQHVGVKCESATKMTAMETTVSIWHSNNGIKEAQDNQIPLIRFVTMA